MSEQQSVIERAKADAFERYPNRLMTTDRVERARFMAGATFAATITPEQIEAGLWAWIESAAEGVTRENVNPRVLELNRPRMIAAARAMGFDIEGES